MLRTVTPPSVGCESSGLVNVKGEGGRLLAPRLAACNIVSHTPGVMHYVEYSWYVFVVQSREAKQGFGYVEAD